MTVRLWEPYAKNAQKKSTQTKMGVTALVSDISCTCMVDNAKLPNLVIVAIHRQVHLLLDKNETFQPLEGRHCAEIQLEWIH